jgi:SAM-dependent methyltransferase
MSIDMVADRSNRQWADRAAALYDQAYARRYRDRDNELQGAGTNQALIDWLGGVCDRFDRPIDALDLGCGTGRYFWGLRNVKTLTGLDASAPMLEEARRPIHGERLSALPVSLIQGDVMTQAFPAGHFDLVYSIGVLAEHVPLTNGIVARVHAWLRPNGRFAFTTVHPASPSVPRTLQRRIASAAVELLPENMTAALHQRLMGGGMYADERWIERQLAGGFAIETIERFSTDVHLHGRVVARKTA